MQEHSLYAKKSISFNFYRKYTQKYIRIYADHSKIYT